MFKKIIDAIVAFFKGPQAAPVVAEAPYKVEASVVTEEVSPELVEALAPVAIAEVPAIVVVEKPKKARKPAAKKPVAAPLRKADQPVPKKPAAKKPAAPKKAPAKKPVAKK
jgi:hypothetical protein